MWRCLFLLFGFHGALGHYDIRKQLMHSIFTKEILEWLQAGRLLRRVYAACRRGGCARQSGRRSREIPVPPTAVPPPPAGRARWGVRACLCPAKRRTTGARTAVDASSRTGNAPFELLHTEEATGSVPVSFTTITQFSGQLRRVRSWPLTLRVTTV